MHRGIIGHYEIEARVGPCETGSSSATAVPWRMHMTATTRLIADRGAACASSEFFRSAAFFKIEGVTHTLMIKTGDGQVNIPLICREIPHSDAWDAISPYGYPGGSLSGDPIDPLAMDLSGTDLVSIFVRDRVGSRSLLHGRPRSRIFLYDPSRPRSVRNALARGARKNESAGFFSDTVFGPNVDGTLLSEFVRCYTETMSRHEAADRYLYTSEYFGGCLDFDDSWLIVTRSPNGDLASGMLLVRSDDHLHYYLGGTSDRYLSNSPSKNTYVATLAFAEKRGIPVNFGGGITPGDGLETFKRGFSNASEEFVTHEIVCDPARYAALSPPDPTPGFFPAYRAGR
jgi:hypothetical protein